MKVKIAYTIDLEEVPIKSAELLEIAKRNLEEALKKISLAFEEIGLDKNSCNSLSSIEEARKNMFTADSLLEDISYIISGYGKAILDQKTPDLEESNKPPDENYFDKLLEEVGNGD